MNDVVATVIRNDIGILDDITELEKSVAGDEAEASLDAGPGPGDQIESAVRKLLIKRSFHVWCMPIFLAHQEDTFQRVIHGSCMPTVSIERLEQEHIGDVAFQHFRRKLNNFLANRLGRQQVVISRDHEVCWN